MDITSYEAILSETTVNPQKNGLDIYVPQAWVVEGEERISYTTLIRLIECCREYHWKKDIYYKYGCIDSICGQINANFIRPIYPNKVISIKYNLRCVMTKKYIIEFLIYDDLNEMCGYVTMVQYFYNPINGMTINAPRGFSKEEIN